MTISEMKENIIAALNTLDVCNSYKSGTQYMIRCFSCGDSKDPTHGHLSIHIDTSDNEQMQCRCFKCPYTGMVTPAFLDEVGVDIDNETRETLALFNKRSFRTNKHTETKKRLIIPEMSEKDLLMTGNAKLEYLADRMGVGVDKIRKYQEYFQIILNPMVFISANGIKYIPNVSYKQLQLFNYNYIGFLSANHNVITFRRITEDENLERYMNVVINPKIQNSNTFFRLPVTFDLLYTHEMHIRVAEGIMDILSIYLNVMNEETENNIYFGCSGFRFISVIKYLITNGVNTDVILHIYSDNDKTDDDHRQYLRNNKKFLPWIKKIFIHRNNYKGEKDFGVPKANIQEIGYELRY